MAFIYLFSGTASVSKAMTNYLDSLLGNPQKNYMKKHFPLHQGYFGEYPDVASFLFVMSIASNYRTLYIYLQGVKGLFD